MVISGFGAGGHRRQDVRGILRGDGPSGATVWIGYMGHDLTHWQNYWNFHHWVAHWLMGKKLWRRDDGICK